MEAQELHRGRLIDHVHLVVRDLAASRRFYEAVFDALGIPIGGGGDDYFWADELFVSTADSEAAQWVALLSGSSEFATVAFGTEGGLFDQAGIPTVVCGPGSMDQGHKPDEYLSVEQLQGCDAMLGRLVAYLRGH